ncbi:MAG: hypothetical protein ACOH16_08100 [Propionibacteriaceae bacterium]
MSITRRTAIVVVDGSGLPALGARSSSTASSSVPAISVEDPWVRTLTATAGVGCCAAAPSTSMTRAAVARRG